MQQRDAGITVRIVFDGSNFCGNPVFVAFEINDAVLSFRAAALMADVVMKRLEGEYGL